MDLIRKYLLSSVLRSPDEGGAPEPEVPEAVAEAVPEVVAETVVEPEAEAEAEPVPPAAPTPPAVPKWSIERLGEETARRRAAETERDNYRAMVERLQAGKEGEQPPAAAKTEQPQDFNTAVRSEAARMRLMEDSTAVRDAGLQTYGQAFGETLSILTAVGATGDDFVLDVLAVDKDNAHKILDKLAKDPERAAAMAGMDSRRRTVELTRMSMAEQAAAPAAVKPAVPAAAPKPAISRAPTPKPAIAPHAAAPEVDPTTPEGNDKMDDKQWETWYKTKYMKKTG